MAAALVAAPSAGCGNLAVDDAAADVRATRTDASDAPGCEAATGTRLVDVPRSDAAADPRAGDLVIYELQVRSANACDPELGEPWQRDACLAAVRPQSWYRAVDSTCDDMDRLGRVRLGTFDDLLEDTDDPRRALTLRYIDERVGANAVWLMPVFPNNDRRVLPDRCDNLGSPYAGRDYMHTRGTLSRDCVADGRDEYSEPPCWGDDAFAAVIDEADRRDLTVMLDVAMNHFGHDYLFYDTAGAIPVREWLDRGFGAESLWDFDATFDPALVSPRPLDSAAVLSATADDGLTQAAAAAVDDACGNLTDAERIQSINLWRVAFDDERAAWPCGAPPTLESVLPAFYLGADNWSFARAESQTTSAYGWNDVKFLFHRGDHPGAMREYLRVREYVFRILNQWVARGVDGFRLDHATDHLSGMSPDEWRYVMAKVEYYAALRGQAPPIWLAEEFHDQEGMSGVADIMTEGYLFGMAARDRQQSTRDVESVLEGAFRFDGDTRVMTALETHDELRLTEGTGFDPYVGHGIWSLGAALWSTPMLLGGQEWGERGRLEFRRAHVIAGRFDGGADDLLVDAYRQTIEARAEIPAFEGWGRAFLRPPGAFAPIDGVVAMLRWDAAGDVVLALHNQWAQDREVELAVPDSLRSGVGFGACERVRLRDVVGGATLVGCREAGELADGFRLWLPAERRFYWLRLERCGGEE